MASGQLRVFYSTGSRYLLGNRFYNSNAIHYVHKPYIACCDILNKEARGGLNTPNVCTPFTYIISSAHVSSVAQLKFKASFHTSSVRNDDPKSLADKTVQILSESKKKEEEKLGKLGIPGELPDAAPDHGKPIPDTSETTTAVAKPQSLKDKAKRIWAIIVKECKHYYHGFRLLFIDVKICSRYVWNVLNGATLTRRERRQLVRTSADLFRLVPFSVFIIVPFMEFTLPFFLKLFPGMLPSTFAVADKELEARKKRLKAKLEIAKFLQDTVEESALVKSGKGQHSELAKEFSNFMKEIREHGTTVKTDDILKFTQLFKDEITLDNMSRPHLIALCKLLGLRSIGTNKMLAFQLQLKLRQLKADDRLISSEGLASLSESELQQACRARGMRALGVPEWRLRLQLHQWLDMHLNDKIPITLLLMSRALYLPEHLSKEEALKTVISKLPENTTTEAVILAAEVTGDTVDPAEKVKLLKAEEEAIAREKAEQLAEAQLSEKSGELLSAAEDLRKHTIVDKALPIDTANEQKPDFITTAVPAASPAPPQTSTVGKESAKRPEEEELTTYEIEQLEDVLEQIAEEKKIQLEKSTLQALRSDFDEYQEDLSQLKSLVEKESTKITESKSAKRLSDSVNRMINDLSKITDDLHKQKQHILEEIEVKQVKIKRSEEIQKDEKALENLQQAIRTRTDDVISINELVLAMKRLQKVPDETRLQKIAQVLDENNDGQIEISHVLRVLSELGTENVKIQGSQMTEIIDLLKKEAILEVKEKEDEKKAAQKDKISINELVNAMKRLQIETDEARLRMLAQALDENNDGQIETAHVLRVFNELGTEDVRITRSQLTEVIDLMKKEAVLEAKKEA